MKKLEIATEAESLGSLVLEVEQPSIQRKNRERFDHSSLRSVSNTHKIEQVFHASVSVTFRGVKYYREAVFILNNF